MKKILFLLFCLSPLIQFAQDFSEQWEGHFSYYNIKKVVKGNDKIYAASENAIFSVNIESNEIEELTTVNGLSGETISTIFYSEIYQLLIIGYENGLIEIAFDNEDDVLTIVDIIDKSAIPPNDKRINHFNGNENLIYISTNFGISVFDLERLEFGDTYFIGNGGSQIQVQQTTIFEGFIYAACLGGNGLRKADVSSSNLIDYNNWQIVTSGNLIGIETNENKLFTIGTNKRIYEVVSDVLTPLFTYDDLPVEIHSLNSYLVVTTKNSVFIYDDSFNLINQASVGGGFNTEFNSALIEGENIYIGSKDFGVLNSMTTNPNEFVEIRPDGPLLNNLFSITYSNNDLWGVSGGYNLFYNFIGGDRVRTGISRLINNEWSNIP
ncbi:MAG: ABC transporter substrate-binding protein, partial [Algibacter sp.]